MVRRKSIKNRKRKEIRALFTRDGEIPCHDRQRLFLTKKYINITVENVQAVIMTFGFTTHALYIPSYTDVYNVVSLCRENIAPNPDF